MNKKIIIGGCALVASMASVLADTTQTNGAKDVSYFNPYASVRGGYMFLGSRDSIKYKGGFSGGVEMGVSYDAWRVGLELAYRQSKIKSINNGINENLTDPAEVPDKNKLLVVFGEKGDLATPPAYLYKLDKVSALAGLINLSYDYAMTEQWSVYAGVGMGVANVAYETPQFTLLANAQDMAAVNRAIRGLNLAGYKGLVHKHKHNRSQNVFAWQARAGVGFEFTENWKLTLGYRLFNTGKVKFVDGKKIKTPFAHTIEAGLTYTF